MEVYFVLDEQGDPSPISDVGAWLDWCEHADRGVARTVVTRDVTVLTTFSGFHEAAEGGAPLLFETRVFGGVLDGEELHHSTRAEAVTGHAMLVGWCQVGNSTDRGMSDGQIA